MQKRFVCLREDVPGSDWLARFVAGRAEAEAWYLNGRAPAPSAAECASAIRRYMPELAGLYESACELVADDGVSAQIISQYRPPPLLHGCTQAVWLGPGGPALIRNYDFPLEVVSDHFQSTRWLGREVISKGQRPWGGCLDGMNADGLVASVTFGGNTAQGQGFSIILIARYVLETCSQVSDAVDALCRIPVALSQNVTVLDKTGAYATVYLTPDRAPCVARTPVCANHQEPVDAGTPTTAISRSIERQSAALRALESRGVSLAQLQETFLRSPLVFARRAIAHRLQRRLSAR